MQEDLTDYLQCPKCGQYHGNDWSQCGSSCPMPMSPKYDPHQLFPSTYVEEDVIDDVDNIPY